MTKRYISPQSGPVDVKTDKGSHTPRTRHTEAAGRQNEVYTPTTEEVRNGYALDEDRLPDLEPYDENNETYRIWMGRQQDISRNLSNAAFGRWLRKVKAEAWYEGYIAAVQNAFPPYDPTGEPMQMNNQNPYRSEEA